ncbi:hypothetical protein FQZ97_1097000 [compost metagenome]
MPRSDFRRHPVGRLLRFQRRHGVFGQDARRGEAVAPHRLVAPCGVALAQTARQLGQRQHGTYLTAFGGVGAVVAAVLASLHGRQHGAVERLHHALRAAARVVATEQCAR